jgi:hypothetical protein
MRPDKNNVPYVSVTLYIAHVKFKNIKKMYDDFGASCFAVKMNSICLLHLSGIICIPKGYWPLQSIEFHIPLCHFRVRYMRSFFLDIPCFKSSYIQGYDCLIFTPQKNAVLNVLFIYSLVCCLFHDINSNSDYVASDDKINSEEWNGNDA